MKGSPNISRIGALIGDPARGSMLTVLMSGKALTASELAREAGITQQTASTHLAKLEQGGLLQLRKQGRHKYFSLFSEEVAHILEALMGLASNDELARIRLGPSDAAMRNARICYNHLAGDKGVQLYDSLILQRLLKSTDGSLTLTKSGERFTNDFGIDVAQLKKGRAVLCRECLDWSERRSHLAGSLGRAYFARFEELRWAKRTQESRVVKFTSKGVIGFNELFAISDTL